MPTSGEERDRILTLLEIGQINAQQAAQLLDALASEPARPPEQRRERTLRIRTTNLSAKSQKVHILASLPLNLIRHSLHLGAQLFPTLSDSSFTELLFAIEHGSTGRLLDLQDLEHGERLEIFVE